MKSLGRKLITKRVCYHGGMWIPYYNTLLAPYVSSNHSKIKFSTFIVQAFICVSNTPFSLYSHKVLFYFSEILTIIHIIHNWSKWSMWGLSSCILDIYTWPVLSLNTLSVLLVGLVFYKKLKCLPTSLSQ